MRNLTDPHNNGQSGSYQSLGQSEEPPANPFASDNDSSDQYSYQSEQHQHLHPQDQQYLYSNQNNSTGNLAPGGHTQSRSPFDDQQSIASSQRQPYFYDSSSEQQPQQHLSPLPPQHQQQYQEEYGQYPYSPDVNAPMMRDFSGQQHPQPPMVPPHFAPGSRQSSASLAGQSAEFDRYPQRISSAAPSISGGHLGHGAALAGGAGAAAAALNRHSTMSDETTSSFSSSSHDYGAGNPFVVNADFSPFGGYPASSFPLHLEDKEADDYLHNPDPILDAKFDRRCQGLDSRGWAALLAFGCLFIGGALLFIVLPVLTYSGVTSSHVVTQRVEKLTDYQYGLLSAIRTDLVDPDTPDSAKSWTAKDGSSWELVFSDEFNMEGRTFYDGDDQFWTAPDLHYAATTDLEWYSPDGAYTENGTLVLQLDAYQNHNLFYQSGMLQSWNKLCFTQGYIEVSAQLPGPGNIMGLWPGIWTIGNLARAGYLATADGVWPYSYNECDAGITPNQSSPDGISFLPGQRLNSCTCPGHDHPNEGTGRGAPEIDALEGTVNGEPGQSELIGIASQSLQTAPFDIWYMPNYDFLEIYNSSLTVMNSYAGGPVQEAISGTTTMNHDWFEYAPLFIGETNYKASYQTFGFEYLNDDTDGYIKWFVGPNPSYALYAPALGPNGNIGQRHISKEPMSIVLNLGISNSWTYIDWASLQWPSHMRIDYVRVYQPSNQQSVTCDPPDYPTYDYIQAHANIYNNPNLTTFAQGGYAFPPTKLLNEC